MKFNTAIAAMMSLVNEIYDKGGRSTGRSINAFDAFKSVCAAYYRGLYEQFGEGFLQRSLGLLTMSRDRRISVEIAFRLTAAPLHGGRSDRLRRPDGSECGSCQSEIAAALAAMNIVKTIVVKIKLSILLRSKVR